MTVEVLYRPDTDKAKLFAGDAVRLALKGDPFDICNAARARMFPVELPERDEGFERVMRARKEKP